MRLLGFVFLLFMSGAAAAFQSQPHRAHAAGYLYEYCSYEEAPTIPNGECVGQFGQNNVDSRVRALRNKVNSIRNFVIRNFGEEPCVGYVTPGGQTTWCNDPLERLDRIDNHLAAIQADVEAAWNLARKGGDMQAAREILSSPTRRGALSTDIRFSRVQAQILVLTMGVNPVPLEYTEGDWLFGTYAAQLGQFFYANRLAWETLDRAKWHVADSLLHDTP